MLPIIICEDQLEHRNYIEELIQKYILIEALDMKIVLSVGDPETVMQYVSQSAPPFLYFLDVELKDDSCSGITLAQKIRKFDSRGFIVFITAHGELSHMTFQYCVEAMDYIVKDYPDRIPDRIKQCLFHARALVSSKSNTIHKVISLNFSEKILLIKQEDLLCLRASQSTHKIKIYTSEGIYEQSTSLKDIMQQLDDRFLLCHKSWVINTEYIKQVDKKRRTVILANSMECPVSFRKMGTLLGRLSNKH